MHFLNIWTIKTTQQLRSIKQDGYSMCIEQFQTNADVKVSNIFLNSLKISTVVCFALETVFDGAI